MNKQELLDYLDRLDHALQRPATLHIYGSAVTILLDEPGRTSLDIDVASTYSHADFSDLRQAARQAGIPINPDIDFSGNHIEWVSALRLCLPPPQPGQETRLWQGSRLTLLTGSIPDLIASKLIRYDEADQSDIQFLCAQSRISFAAVEDAVHRLPPPFDSDPLVHENLKNFKTDLAFWQEASL